MFIFPLTFCYTQMYSGQKFGETWFEIASMFCYDNFLLLNMESNLIVISFFSRGNASICMWRIGFNSSMTKGLLRTGKEKQFMTLSYIHYEHFQRHSKFRFEFVWWHCEKLIALFWEDERMWVRGYELVILPVGADSQLE